jgi:uroporphyrinogen-III synthase
MITIGYIAILMKVDILSTKTLTESQVELVLNTGMSITHYNVLITEHNSITPNGHWGHVIITSQNAIPAVLENRDHIKQISCVGNVTSDILISNGITPLETADHSSNLALKLTDTYPDHYFTYLCSKQRREELPALFLEKKIPLKELIVYRSIAVMKSFDRIFAAVTFYSPKGVHAFAKANQNNKPLIAICIGDTTARTAMHYYKNVKIATKQTVENTLITAIKALHND